MDSNGRSISRPADVLGDVPALCWCVIIDTHSVDPPLGYPQFVNYADAILYDVDAQTPSGPMRYTNVKPREKRWPRPWLVQGHLPEFATNPQDQVFVQGVVVNGEFFLNNAEPRYAAPCDGGA